MLHRLAVVVVLLLAGALFGAGPAAAQEAGAGPADNVPAAELREFRNGIVDPDSELSDVQKIRRLSRTMRNGRALLRKYPEAENLYIVRHVMLEAARNLMSLGEPVSRDEVVELARDIVAAEPPPQWRFSADVLLVQLRAAQAADDRSKVTDVLDEFVQTYQEDANRAYAARALMEAAQMARAVGAEKAYDRYLDTLRSDYSWEEGVVGFLMSHGQAPLGSNSPFVARLEFMDGTKLLMPQETFHLTVAILFWSAKDKRSLELMEHLQGTYERHREEGFLAIGINMDEAEDEALVRRTLKEKGITWPQTFSGQGLEEPVAKHYGIAAIPGVWLIGALGMTDAKPGHRGMMWKEIGPRIRSSLERDRRPKRRQWSVRSGLFRAEAFLQNALERADQPGAVPADELRSLLDAFFVMDLSPHMAERATAARALHQRVAALVESHADAPNILELRALEMTLLAYRGLVEQDDNLEKQAKERAEAFLDDEQTPAHLRMLSDYLSIRMEYAPREDAYLHVDEQVNAFRARYEDEDLHWLKTWLRYMLWVELGGPGWTVPMTIGLGRQAREGAGAPRSGGLLRGLLGGGVYMNRRHDVTLEKFDGSKLKLPEELMGSFYSVWFWTMDCPPGAEWFQPLPADEHNTHFNKLTPYPEDSFHIVGVNMDADREAARKYAEEHFPNWIHTYIGPDREHRLVHQFDIQALPSAWFVMDDGVWSTHDNEHGITRLGEPIRSLTYDLKNARKTGKNVEQWSKAFGRYRDALRKYKLHQALHIELEGSRRRFEPEARELGLKVGPKLLAAGLELNRAAVRKQREALRKLLPQLERGEGGEWGPEDKLQQAWQHVRAYRRAAQNLEAIPRAARESARYISEEFPADDYIVDAPDPLDLPENFPEPPPEETESD